MKLSYRYMQMTGDYLIAVCDSLLDAPACDSVIRRLGEGETMQQRILASTLMKGCTGAYYIPGSIPSDVLRLADESVMACEESLYEDAIGYPLNT